MPPLTIYVYFVVRFVSSSFCYVCSYALVIRIWVVFQCLIKPQSLVDVLKHKQI